MDQVLIQIVMDDQGEVSLEYLADLVRLLSPEEIVKLLTHLAAELDKLSGSQTNYCHGPCGVNLLRRSHGTWEKRQIKGTHHKGEAPRISSRIFSH